MFEVEYLWNSGVKKDEINANQIEYDCLTLDTRLDFTLGPGSELTVHAYSGYHNITRLADNAFVFEAVQISSRSDQTQCYQRLATAAIFFSKGVVLPERNNAEMRPANYLKASAKYSEYID